MLPPVHKGQRPGGWRLYAPLLVLVSLPRRLPASARPPAAVCRRLSADARLLSLLLPPGAGGLRAAVQVDQHAGRRGSDARQPARRRHGERRRAAGALHIARPHAGSRKLPPLLPQLMARRPRRPAWHAQNSLISALPSRRFYAAAAALRNAKVTPPGGDGYWSHHYESTFDKYLGARAGWVGGPVRVAGRHPGTRLHSAAPAHPPPCSPRRLCCCRTPARGHAAAHPGGGPGLPHVGEMGRRRQQPAGARGRARPEGGHVPCVLWGGRGACCTCATAAPAATNQRLRRPAPARALPAAAVAGAVPPRGGQLLGVQRHLRRGVAPRH